MLSIITSLSSDDSKCTCIKNFEKLSLATKSAIKSINFHLRYFVDLVHYSRSSNVQINFINKFLKFFNNFCLKHFSIKS